MRCKRCASPFPDASHLTLAGKFVAILNDGRRMPVFEPNVAAVEIDKYWLMLRRVFCIAVSIRDAIRPVAVIVVRLHQNRI